MPLSDDACGADVRQGPSGTGDLGESVVVRKSVAEVQGLVVDSLHQGKGIGLRRIPDGRVLVTLKLFVISRSHLSVVGL